MNNNTILKINNISKSFINVHALKNVSLEIKKGEIHAIAGENGAGKSTLIAIISGVSRPDSGEIYFDGEKLDIANAGESKSIGISTVYQELSLVPNLSIAENIFAGKQPVNKAGFINKRKMELESKKLLNIFNIDLAVNEKVGRLKIAERQIIEILKAISNKVKILILDEPTSSIDLNEKADLFVVLKKLKNEGVSIIYVSHHLDKVFEIADRVTVLRDGEFIDTKKINDISEEELIKLMTGKYLKDIYSQKAINEKELLKSKKILLKVENVSYRNILNNISFELFEGEILGICGLIGSGKTELLEVIYGANKKKNGKIFINNREIKNNTIKTMRNNKVAYLCEDRKISGLFLNMNISENLYSVNNNMLSSFGFINQNKIKKLLLDSIKKFNIITPNLSQKVLKLSGGNQQKVLIAMWLTLNPNILLVNEPTRGIDVGAKVEIHSILNKLRESGSGVIMASSEFTELINLADRIIILRRGEIVKELINKNISEEKLVEYASGLNL